jgi:hypothetical protein
MERKIYDMVKHYDYSLRFNSTTSGYLEFHTRERKNDMLAKLQDNNTLFANFANGNKDSASRPVGVIIDPLPDSLTIASIRQAFVKFGPIRSIRFVWKESKPMMFAKLDLSSQVTDDLFKSIRASGLIVGTFGNKVRIGPFPQVLGESHVLE